MPDTTPICRWFTIIDGQVVGVHHPLAHPEPRFGQGSILGDRVRGRLSLAGRQVEIVSAAFRCERFVTWAHACIAMWRRDVPEPFGHYLDVNSRFSGRNFNVGLVFRKGVHARRGSVAIPIRGARLT